MITIIVIITIIIITKLIIIMEIIIIINGQFDNACGLIWSNTSELILSNVWGLIWVTPVDQNSKLILSDVCRSNFK